MTFIDNVADSKEAEYTYDPLGRRIMRKDVDNNTYTYYYYNGLTVLAEKKKVGAGNPTWDKLLTVAPGVIGNILRSNLNYYHYDAMGNLIFVADFDGTPSQSFEQEAYGNVKSGSQSGYHLTTKEYDSIPELYCFWYRWYDPVLGRFITRAPFPGYIEHPYNYTENNPLSNIDPYGKFVMRCSDTSITRSVDRQLCGGLVSQNIDDVRLWVCIENMINDSTSVVTCDSTRACIMNPTARAHTTGNGMNFCPDRNKGCGKRDVCKIIIHEFAHKCGWNERPGRTDPGVPGGSGRYKCCGD